MEYHQISLMFPLMEGTEFEEFADNIQDYGLKEPILLADGKIADGRNRHRACLARGVKPRFVQWKPTKANPSLAIHVITRNLMRRQLTVGQRGLIAVQTVPFFEEENRQRQLRERIGGSRKSSGNERVCAPPRPGILGTSDKHDAESGTKAGQTVGVSRDTIEHAQAVIENAAPEVIEAVKAGQMTLHAATEAAQLPDARQKVIAEFFGQDKRKGRKELRAALKEETSDEGDAAELLDDVGKSVPENLVPVFKAREHFDKGLTLIHQIKAHINALYGLGKGLIDQKADIVDYKNLHAAFKFGRPYAVCPVCAGKGCHKLDSNNTYELGACHRKGWMRKDEWDHYQDMRRPTAGAATEKDKQ